MDTDQMIRELRKISDDHKNDHVDTFSINWSLLCRDVADKIDELNKSKNDVYLEFSNELKSRLNNASRYHGGEYNGRNYPYVETFDVDDVYEIIDRILCGIEEDENN